MRHAPAWAYAPALLALMGAGCAVDRAPDAALIEREADALADVVDTATQRPLTPGEIAAAHDAADGLRRHARAMAGGAP